MRMRCDCDGYCDVIGVWYPFPFLFCRVTPFFCERTCMSRLIIPSIHSYLVFDPSFASILMSR